MAVGKGSILRAGSANDAISTDKKQSVPLSIATKVPVEALKSVPKAWGIPKIDEEKVAGLSASMENFGMLRPILVYKNKKQELVILKGYHRNAAAKRAGILEVPVFFLEFSAESKAKEAYAELRSYETDDKDEREYEVVSSIASDMPAYLL